MRKKGNCELYLEVELNFLCVQRNYLLDSNAMCWIIGINNIYRNKQDVIIVFNIILHFIVSPQYNFSNYFYVHAKYKNFIAALTTGNVANAVT